ncbi:MAG: hypothetical protein CLLPBCKN_007839 [Chroococcidiopsis cubana SAG 39.79]|uniref:Cyclic nucleotide-binding protein n=1 Tax=Chroococcidiopsis cubana SAG 39.79 TaxID=388085 RepID=A0AB37US08_9CYAN|nr:tetratricopeptide repeat protein [Chroococcidiopsis cubana]MDZ4878404.1 hypothetical protein [Chroococcidiopsis cubana SAG 39.79]RUT14238.1 hypothetical protein DSM107010_02690 [Chroococcidiopsis cubana SAG 39.79]
MLDLIAAAFERQDYDTAAQLLQQLRHSSPTDPWVQFYSGRLDEISGKLDTAAEIYRQLLLSSVHVHARIMAQARQGITRIESLLKAQRQQAIAQAIADPDNMQKGVLVLEPIASDRKSEAARRLSQIMQIDPYTARLQLPSRGWRLYRTGAIGELQFFGQQLLAADIPCFWATLAEIEQIQVFQARYFEVAPAASVVCQNEVDELSFLSFQWSEVTHKVTGLLPLFEQVVDINVRGKLQRKTQTQDYAQFCDLHLSDRGYIVRLCDRDYMFHNGISFSEQQTHNQTTVRINWNHLQNFLDQKLERAESWSDFTIFANTALDWSDLLAPIPSHIHLFRRDPSNWDAAFHLYSGLVFLKRKEKLM